MAIIRSQRRRKTIGKDGSASSDIDSRISQFSGSTRPSRTTDVAGTPTSNNARQVSNVTNNLSLASVDDRSLVSWALSLLSVFTYIWSLASWVFGRHPAIVAAYDRTIELAFMAQDERGRRRGIIRYAKVTLDTGLRDHNLISLDLVNRLDGIEWISDVPRDVLNGLGGTVLSVGTVKARWGARRSDSWIGRKLDWKFYESEFAVCAGNFDVLICRETMKEHNLPQALPPGYAGFRPELPAIDRRNNASHQASQDQRRKQNAADKQKRRNDGKKETSTDQNKPK